WRALAKDGADLPIGKRAVGSAHVRLGVGETYDFEWTPERPMNAALTFRFDGDSIRQVIRVRP
ncbi:MAG TPA: hypothetical protein VMN78_03490, partial [Longimicrobiales bacterium]|nr:hypothetical protein [Longimicrobiales bacterium]